MQVRRGSVESGKGRKGGQTERKGEWLWMGGGRGLEIFTIRHIGVSGWSFLVFWSLEF